MERGIESSYRAYFPAIRAKCARVLADPEEAQDVAQETFIRLWRSGLAAGDPKRATAWIYTTCTRLAVDRLRRTRRGERAAKDRPEAGEQDDPEVLLQRRQALHQIARQVPAKELEVVILHRVDGLSHLEVAEVQGSSERTVRRLLARFDGRLAELGVREESLREPA